MNNILESELVWNTNWPMFNDDFAGKGAPDNPLSEGPGVQVALSFTSLLWKYVIGCLTHTSKIYT